MTDLILLSESQMARISPFFPLSHGMPRVDDRRVISGIIFVIRNGLRRHDPVDEARHGVGPEEVDRDGEPGHGAGDAAEHERCPVDLALRVGAGLHQPTEQDHRRVDTEEPEEGGDVDDADESGDEHDHQ